MSNHHLTTKNGNSHHQHEQPRQQRRSLPWLPLVAMVTILMTSIISILGSSKSIHYIYTTRVENNERSSSNKNNNDDKDNNPTTTTTSNVDTLHQETMSSLRDQIVELFKVNQDLEMKLQERQDDHNTSTIKEISNLKSTNEEMDTVFARKSNNVGDVIVG